MFNFFVSKLKNIRVWFYYLRLNRFRNNLFTHIIAFSKKKESYEYRDEIEFIRKNGLSVFPYSFTTKYSSLEVTVNYEDGYPFVNHNGNRFFFKKGWTEGKVKKYYSGLLSEQDIDSPHLYCDEIFNAGGAEILLDIGVAEGSFSLDQINSVKEVVILEKDDLWVDALERTFKPFKDKIQIIKKFASNTDSFDSIRPQNLPSLWNKDLFIKIDVDGDERKVIQGLENLLKNNQPIRIALCVYHQQDDYNYFVNYFTSIGYSISVSNGYMLYLFDKKIKKPFFRKGILRLTKVLS
ncbi:hypothetical protein CLV31_12425 [Algoriphagus aquaeductus]|uniref:FkbM family methyltransferase n=1 Tax=Algoriphagus aquaeductus TaxID=475299 RepID=A0A326RKN5_9BACT|nr:hypothetical protein [Algoriphagus aquaeductus]PZV76700.1 hypothetical protein CLV31_12425 [Algoriphagus aquaeductus]